MKPFYTTLKTLVLAALILSLPSCSKDKEPTDIIYVIKGDALPGASAGVQAYGSINGGYSATYKKIAFNINWYNLSSDPLKTSFQFEDGAGNPATIKVFAVTEGKRNGLTAGEMYLTDEQEQALLKGEFFYTVHSVSHPDGEITGRLELFRNQ